MQRYEQVYEGNELCKKSNRDWTIQELQSQRSDLIWKEVYYEDTGYDTYVPSIRGISACVDICQSINDCVYFSTSETKEGYACSVYKTCDYPMNSNHVNEFYKIYRMAERGNIFDMYIQIISFEYLGTNNFNST